MKDYSTFYQGENRSLSDQVGFYSLKNADVHTELGTIKPSLALEADGTTVNEKAIILDLSNGDILFFSTASGKVWKKTGTTYSLVHTNTQGANRGAYLWQGYVYYATTGKLGRITEAFASSETTWSSQNDSWGTFSKGGAYKPFYEVGADLYIGDGSYLASVDLTHNFIVDALDIPSKYTITSLMGYNNDILIGTTISATQNSCMIYGFNGYSPSWSYEDRVSERAINTFIEADNIVLFQAGKHIYYWTGGSGARLKRIKGITQEVNPYATAEYFGRGLFTNGTSVFSIHREDGDLPYAIVKEFTATSAIQSVKQVGDVLYVSCSGVMKTGTALAGMEIETPEAYDQFSKVEVGYRTNTGTITIYTKKDYGSYVEQTSVVDSINKKVYFNGGLGKTNTLQVKIVTTGTVEITSIIFI